MTPFPIEYFTAKLTRHDPLLQWIEFRGGRHWLRRSDNDCEFKIGLASEVYDVFKDEIIIRDSLGNEFETEISPTSAPVGFPDFDYLPASQKKILNVKVPLGDDRLSRFPLHFFAPTIEKVETHIFSIEPSLLYPTFLFDAVQNYGHLVAKKFENFVETGSLYGHTFIHASYYFDKVFSVELSKELYDYLKPIVKVLPKIHLYHGNSFEHLPKIIEELTGPSVFFLDAHWSGDSTTDWDKGSFTGYPSDTAHSGTSSAPSPQEQKPILSELSTILERFKYPALILIDDWNIVGKKGNEVFEKFDWSHISKNALQEIFDMNSRIKFHWPLGDTRYIVGISAAPNTYNDQSVKKNS